MISLRQFCAAILDDIIGSIAETWSDQKNSELLPMVRCRTVAVYGANSLDKIVASAESHSSNCNVFLSAGTGIGGSGKFRPVTIYGQILDHDIIGRDIGI